MGAAAGAGAAGGGGKGGGARGGQVAYPTQGQGFSPMQSPGLQQQYGASSAVHGGGYQGYGQPVGQMGQFMGGMAPQAMAGMGQPMGGAQSSGWRGQNTFAPPGMGQPMGERQRQFSAMGGMQPPQNMGGMQAYNPASNMRPQTTGWLGQPMGINPHAQQSMGQPMGYQDDMRRQMAQRMQGMGQAMNNRDVMNQKQGLLSMLGSRGFF